MVVRTDQSEPKTGLRSRRRVNVIRSVQSVQLDHARVQGLLRSISLFKVILQIGQIVFVTCLTANCRIGEEIQKSTLTITIT
jgi:hypothetical protein